MVCVQFNNILNKACGMCVYFRGRQRRALEEGEEEGGMGSMFQAVSDPQAHACVCVRVHGCACLCMCVCVCVLGKGHHARDVDLSILLSQCRNNQTIEYCLAVWLNHWHQVRVERSTVLYLVRVVYPP